jgi:hypothetical protein
MMNQVVEIAKPASVQASSPMTPMDLMQRALEAGNLELVERMMVLQERWEKNQARKSFDAAMSLVRAELPVIIKNRSVGFTSSRTGGSTSYRHEDLAGIARQVDPLLARHGLTYRFRTACEAGRLTVTCILSHSDGHYEENTLSAPHDTSGQKNPHQAIASAQTYLQRYTLKAALGLSASEDDDGRGGRENTSPAPDVSEPLMTEDHVEQIKAALEARNMPIERFMKWASASYRGVEQLETISDIADKHFMLCLRKIQNSGT